MPIRWFKFSAGLGKGIELVSTDHEADALTSDSPGPVCMDHLADCCQ